MTDFFLSDKYRRRIFFGSSILAIFILLILRNFLIPYLVGSPIPELPTVIYSIIDNLFTALVASVIVSLLVMWLIPPLGVTAETELIESFRIREELEEARHQTHEWWYKGAIGRHFRSVTLPYLARSSKDENITIKINVLLLNPNKGSEYFNLHRTRLVSSEKNKYWTPDIFQKELIATILSIYSTKATYPSIEITLGFMEALSVFRVDMSPKMALLTTEGHQDPAIKCKAGSHLYKSLREDFSLNLQQAWVLPSNIKGIPAKEFDVAKVKNILGELGILEHQLTDSAINEIINLVRKSKDPYH